MDTRTNPSENLAQYLCESRQDRQRVYSLLIHLGLDDAAISSLFTTFCIDDLDRVEP